ncbi:MULTISPECIES: DUF305 domain-containing protein [Chelativorans]|uniref:DUF305 domain-containing protein n=1 Tax=Chelativorans TaxID=449972 RepID=UPI0018DE8E0A
MRAILLSTAIIALLTAPGYAQDTHAGHGAAPAASSAELPAICKSEAANSAQAHAMPPSPDGLDEGRKALIESMAAMNEMGMAMMAPDIDVAFVCGMIPHHKGAIAMAKAELDHGDDPWAKELAQKVIAAQEQEIAEMLEWLEAQAK